MEGPFVNAGLPVEDVAGLLNLEASLDVSTCGMSLAEWEATRLRSQGAHDPTPTHYFVLEELFGHFHFGSDAHLLDVGCGTGRVLAFCLQKAFPCKVTGIELDPQLASVAREWTARCDGVDALQGSVLDLDLGQFTHFYLFNPFDSDVLQRFIAQVEAQVKRPCTVVHMSDNGETWWYMGRAGWSEVASGEIVGFRNAFGSEVKVFEHPQHYTVWRYDGSGSGEGFPFSFSFGLP